MQMRLLLLLIAGLFAACHHTEEGAHSHAAPAPPVQLDGDHRWQADEATSNNVALLQQQAAERKRRPHNTVGDYQQTGAVLQTGLNQLIKQCTMKGPEHDALHLWLEPLLHDNRELQKVADVNAGDRLFYAIRTRLADYDLYFQ